MASAIAEAAISSALQGSRWLAEPAGGWLQIYLQNLLSMKKGVIIYNYLFYFILF